MNLSNLFRFAYWLDPAVTSQPAGPRIWVVIGVALAWAVAWLLMGRRLGRGVVLAQVLAGGIAAAVGLGRWLLIPGLGWRVGWLIAGLIALAPLVWVWLRMARNAGWVRTAIAAAAFAPTPNPSPSGRGERSPLPIGEGLGVGRFANYLVVGGWLVFHILGMAITTSVHRWPLWVGWMLMAVVLLPMVLRLRPTPRALIALTPLLLVYLAIGLRVLTGFLNYLINAEYRVPEPYSTIFNPTLALLGAVGYGFVLSARMALPDDRTFIKIGALTMIGLVVLWSLYTSLSLRTYGVSGSDPYAYTQMGIDLATHGSVFHHFPLVRLTYDLNIPSEPVVHIGYRLPTDVTRMSPTVWPPGYAVFTALAYLIGGETGIFVLAPLLGAVSLLLIGWLVWLCLPENNPARPAIIALTVLLCATGYQQIEWQLIPMADIASQVFSLLALALAMGVVGQRLKPSEGFRRLLSLAAGLCIGIAFGIRYTQVLIAPAVALALCLDSTEQRFRLALTPSNLLRVLIAGIGAAIAAAPTLAYHAVAFGSPLQTGSDELKHFVLALLPQTLQRLSGELFWYREFGLVWPFMVLGLVALWRNHRRTLIILLAYTLPVLIFHLLYSYVRQRDLLSIFPIFYFFAAVGVVDGVRWLLNRVERPAMRWRAFAIITLICFMLMQRSVETLMLPITRGFGAFGYLVREQRQSFTRLAELTPSNAVIACSLNSGAVDLHAGRLSFRPAGWTADQLSKFVLALQQEGTPVFLLEDGKELAESIATLQAQFKLSEVGQIDIPYYFPNSGGSENRRVSLYRIEQK